MSVEIKGNTGEMHPVPEWLQNIKVDNSKQRADKNLSLEASQAVSVTLSQEGKDYFRKKLQENGTQGISYEEILRERENVAKTSKSISVNALDKVAYQKAEENKNRLEKADKILKENEEKIKRIKAKGSSATGSKKQAQADKVQGKNQNDNMSASSGKDVLGITKGEKENGYVIHFSDSAMVNRAVSRGYITVNGVDIFLSDEDKKRLLEVDKEAQAKREAAFSNYVMEHEMAVDRQQSAALAGANRDEAKAMAVMAKVARGEKASDEELQMLMKLDPKLYSMAMSLGSMQKDGASGSESDVKNSDTSEKEKIAAKGISWGDFEWKSYETQMEVSLEGNAKIEGISEGEVVL